MIVAFLVCIVFSALTVYLLLLCRSFSSLSIAEIKRRAQAGDQDAKKVFPVRSESIKLWFILYWTIAVTALTAVTAFNGLFWQFVIVATLFSFAAIIIPISNHQSLGLAAMASPVLERIIRLFYPILKYIEMVILKFSSGVSEAPKQVHSREELLDLLALSTKNFDHAGKSELQIAANALTYGELLVGDYMTPLNTVKFIAENDTLTPVVLGELHDSGHSRFPVYRGNNQQVIGTLYIKDALNIKEPKLAKDVMRNDVYYINESTNLDKALGAFIKTKHHLFIVVNEFEDVVGVITVEDVLEQIVGAPILDEFDQYDDLRAVAHKNAKTKREEAGGEHVI